MKDFTLAVANSFNDLQQQTDRTLDYGSYKVGFYDGMKWESEVIESRLSVMVGALCTIANASKGSLDNHASKLSKIAREALEKLK